jgi:proline iminopeptidase
MIFVLRLLIAVLAFPAVATASETPRFATSADGAKIAYYAPETLRGVPLLVLSGGPGTDSRYMRVNGALDRLAESRPLIFFDQRGTSRSSPSDGTETIAKYVEDLEAIRKAVRADRIDILGHSFGGYLAIAYTAAYPQRVRGLVLVDSAPPKLGDVTQLLPDVYPDRIDAWRQKRATLGRNNPSSESAIFMSMEFVTEQAFRDYLKAVESHRDNMDVNNGLRRDMADLDYWPQVRRFKQPTLVIHGRFDAVVAPSNGWRLHHAIPNSSFRIIESAGHLPHIEMPDQFLEIVGPFLSELDASASNTKSISHPKGQER